FGSIRAQAQRALATMGAEIERRERELKHLIEQSQHWRSALVIKTGASGRRSSAVAAGRDSRTAIGGDGKRVDWDEVLASVPKRYGVEEVMKHPGARAKGRPQIYPAVNRWEAAKKIRRVGQGQYERVSGGQTRLPTKAKAATKRRTAA